LVHKISGPAVSIRLALRIPPTLSLGPSTAATIFLHLTFNDPDKVPNRLLQRLSVQAAALHSTNSSSRRKWERQMLTAEMSS
jgi:hypothetical protein